MPTHAPTGSILSSFETTEIFARAGDPLDLDDLLRDLRHLRLEQPAQELRVRPRQDHLGPARRLVHGDDVGLDVVALVEPVARDLLARRQNGFRPLQLHVDVPAVHLLHGPAHHLAHAVVIVLVDPLALGLAHLLHQDLLGRRNGVPPQVLQRELGRQFLPQRRLLVQRLRLRQVDLEAQVFGVLDDGPRQLHDDPPARVVEGDVQLGVDAEALPPGRKEAGHERFDDGGLVDALLARDLGHRLDQLVVRISLRLS
jgi:hypothetical protein